MPNLVVSLAGKPQATHAITRPCTRIGRAPGNDIVLERPTVSSAHALLLVSGARLAIEDLGSSNGTFVAHKRIERAELEDGSVVMIGDYTLKLVADRKAMAYERTLLVRSSAVARKAYLQRLDGSQRGECIALTKVVSTMGRPGAGMVTFIRRGDEFAVRCADGPRPLLNGSVLADAPVRLNAGDVLDTDHGRLQFLLQESSPQAPSLEERYPPAAKVAPSSGPLSWLRRAIGGAPAA
ncbi:FHA domain-containing protein [Ramlibacter sp. MMS24-I3-19]|uniref:FHA domain-containing protein n=1 Tax=Ramlibacter sp. MMS24-I3-19 TaxID=3416606 RepID=UPI003D03F354